MADIGVSTLWGERKTLFFIDMNNRKIDKFKLGLDRYFRLKVSFNGLPEDFSVENDIQVIARHAYQEGYEIPASGLSYSGDTLSFYFRAEDQVRSGRYRIVLNYIRKVDGRSPEMAPIPWNGYEFELVTNSEEVSNTSSCTDINTDGVDLDVEVSTGGDIVCGAQVIEVANEQEALERSANDTKNLYVWE